MAIAYFSTWTTYGTWLPGDGRGWHSRGGIWQSPDLEIVKEAQYRMTETTVLLDELQRRTVEDVIAEHGRIRGWQVHAVSCRSNHVHVVVTAAGAPLERPREQFKYWGTRRLKEKMRDRKHWWSDGGWDVYIDEDEHLERVVRYVCEGQDWNGSDAGASD